MLRELNESDSLTESDDIVQEFDVRPGALYELRLVLVDLGAVELSACRCRGRFRRGENSLSAIVDFPVEIFPPSVADALDPPFVESSRFFRAPALASRIQFTFDSPVVVRGFKLARLALTAREYPGVVKDLTRIQESRRAEITARSCLPEEIADLLDYPARQFADITEYKEPRAVWSNECCGAPDFRQEMDNFHSRVVETDDSKPAIAFIGSKRTFLHLSGTLWPVVPRVTEQLNFADAMPDALVIEETIDDIHSEWMQELFPPDGVLGNRGRELLDYAQNAGIPIVWLRQSTDATAPQSEYGRTIELTPSGGGHPYVDLRLIAPLASSQDAHKRLLFPCASDLYAFGELRAALTEFDASDLMVTEAQYGMVFNPHTRNMIQIKNAAIIPCTSYLHLCKLYRNAGIVLLFEQTLRTRSMQLTLIADAVGSGCVVVYVGDAAVLGQAAELVWPAEDIVRAGEIVTTLCDPFRNEQAWLDYYRRLSRHCAVERLLNTLPGIDMSFPQTKRASVITVSNRPHLFEQILENYRRQSYENKELILIFNCYPFDLPAYDTTDITVYFIEASYNIGYCLNFGRRKITGHFWFKMDDDDVYGQHYLEDMINAFYWSSADVVGKPQAIAYLEASDYIIFRRQSKKLFRRWMGQGNLCGATLSGRTSSALPWFTQSYRNAVDSEWVYSAFATHKILFSDSLNYIIFRSADDEHHTWRISGDFLIQQSSGVIENISDRLGYRASARELIDEWS